VDLDSQRTRRLGPQTDVRFGAVSPDGRWIATGSHWSDSPGAGAKIWDSRTGRLVSDLPDASGAVQFSPDGRWLLTGGGGPRLWRVGTWQRGSDLSGTSLNPAGAFTSDGKLLALGDAPGMLRLVITQTGAEVARLTAPVKSRLVPRCFTKDQGELIAVGAESGAIYTFDLQAIRVQLAEFGLDWEPKASVQPSSAGLRPPLATRLQITVDAGNFAFAPDDSRASCRKAVGLNSLLLTLNPFNFQAALQRGDAYTLLDKSQEAMADYAWALRMIPVGATEHFSPARARNFNNVAWTWAVESRDPAQGRRALLLAAKAVELSPKSWLYHNTLGVVRYRLADFQQALEHLEQSLSANGEQSAAFDLFFMAMCHQRLGDHSRAHECFARAARWTDERKGQLSENWAKELSMFRAEAAEVLGIANPPSNP
jgi:tetratricopeptide (TPR) repeat protein